MAIGGASREDFLSGGDFFSRGKREGRIMKPLLLFPCPTPCYCLLRLQAQATEETKSIPVDSKQGRFYSEPLSPSPNVSWGLEGRRQMFPLSAIWRPNEREKLLPAAEAKQAWQRRKKKKDKSHIQ